MPSSAVASEAPLVRELFAGEPLARRVLTSRCATCCCCILCKAFCMVQKYTHRTPVQYRLQDIPSAIPGQLLLQLQRCGMWLILLT